jgi:hypothetical protein
MNQQEVRLARFEALDRLSDARAAVERAQVDLRNLSRKCPHFDAVRTSHMGESCTHCNDCGGCDVVPADREWRSRP